MSASPFALAFTLMDDVQLLDYWNRNYVPWPEEILLDDKVALMTPRAFDRLPEYYVLQPTALDFPGKRWKEQAGRFVLPAPLQTRWILVESGGFAGFANKYWDIVIV